MAIKITEDGAVRYVNENDVDRTLFPNLSGAMGDEQYDALNGRLTVVEGKVTELEECCTDVNNSIAELKTDALSAYIVETATGAVASFSDGADDVPVKDLTVAIEPVQSGSGDPSPENIRPISGWTGAKVTKTGKNWLDKTLLSDISAYDDLASGYYYTEPITLVPNTQYVMSPSSTSSLGVSDYYVLYINPSDSDPDYLVITNQAIKYPVEEGLPKTVTFTTGATGTIRLGVVMVSGGPKQSALTAFMSINYQLELGSTATAYEPYQGETYEVDWTTEAGTVYGGTLDVTTGVLTVDSAMVTLSQLTDWGDFSTLSNGVMRTPVPFIVKQSNAEVTTATMSTRKPKAYGPIQVQDVDSFAVNSSGYVIVPMDREITVEEFLAECGNDQLCYPLSISQTYQLTPQEVSTVLGQNNIFADCGNVTVQYRADTKLYIDKVLNA